MARIWYTHSSEKGMRCALSKRVEEKGLAATTKILRRVNGTLKAAPGADEVRTGQRSALLNSMCTVSPVKSGQRNLAKGRAVARATSAKSAILISKVVKMRSKRAQISMVTLSYWKTSQMESLVSYSWFSIMEPTMKEHVAILNVSIAGLTHGRSPTPGSRRPNKTASMPPLL